MSEKGETRSIGVRLPTYIFELVLKNVIAPGEYQNFSDYVRDLIRQDLRKRGLL